MPGPIGIDPIGVEPINAPPSGTSPPPPPPPPPATFEQNLSSFLTSMVTGITAWHGRIPQKATLPTIVWIEVDGDSGLNLGGPSGLASKHIQFTVYGIAPADCWTWIETLRQAFCNRGNRASVQAAGFLSVHAHGSRSQATPTVVGSDKATHSAMREFFFWYPEPQG